jgi:hypothetical protein
VREEEKLGWRVKRIGNASRERTEIEESRGRLETEQNAKEEEKEKEKGGTQAR